MNKIIVVLALSVICVSLQSSAEGKKEMVKRPYTTKGWELVWADEFDVDGHPDESIWSHEEGFVRNHEPQYYTVKRLENCRVENGILIITARKEKYPNKEWKNRHLGGWNREREFAEYTSAAIESTRKKTFLYGRIEVRAQVPSSSGAWPAIWTLGQSIHESGESYWNWPACGEIDIMEMWCSRSNTVYSFFHTSKEPVRQGAPHAGMGGGEITLSEKDAPWNGFHVYTIDWDENDIFIYYDGRQYGHLDVSQSDWPDGQNPFRKPHFLILNLALGGWDNDISDKTVFPMEYKIDYVRYFKKKK
jgi:beta-glucanase (GH16 family)